MPIHSKQIFTALVRTVSCSDRTIPAAVKAIPRSKKPQPGKFLLFMLILFTFCINSLSIFLERNNFCYFIQIQFFLVELIKSTSVTNADHSCMDKFFLNQRIHSTLCLFI